MAANPNQPPDPLTKDFTQADFYALSQLLHGMPTEQIDQSVLNQVNGLQNIFNAVLNAEPADRLDAFTAAIAHRNDRDWITQKILSINPNCPPKNTNYWQNSSLVPDLPAYGQLSPDKEREALENNAWLNDYTEYGRQRIPMLPAHFHESAALFLGAVAIARRLRLNMGFGEIYPNVFILWTATTSIFNKSTGLNLVEEMVNNVMPHLKSPVDFTREALIDSLGGKEPANIADINMSEEDQKVYRLSKKFASKRAIIIDEASSLFLKLKREMNIGMAELLLSLFDCPPEYRRETKGGGLVIVKQPYLNFLGATTPVMLKETNTVQLWNNGLWARFNHLIPFRPPVGLITTTHIPSIPDHLLTQLDKLANHFLPSPKDFEFPECRGISFSNDAQKAYTNYDFAIRDGIIIKRQNELPSELLGLYGRLPVLSLKFSIILAALDWNGQSNVPVIETRHFYRAQMLAETMRMGAHHLLQALNGTAEIDSTEQRIINKVTRFIAEKGECTTRDIARSESKLMSELDPILYRMVEGGLLEQRMEGRKRLLLTTERG